MQMMSENETNEFLRKLVSKGWTLGLERIETVLVEWGQPQSQFQSIHVAGTNGKGSTCAMLESVLRRAGYKTGLFTSPHLLRVEERIQISGVALSHREFQRRISEAASLLERAGCSYFEALTAVAFKCFADHGVEIAVVETGMGGRYDATNVLTPVVSLVTDIDLDHVEHLGSGRGAIAAEKAGIMKPAVPCLSLAEDDETRVVFERVAQATGTPLSCVWDSCRTSNVQVTEAGSTFDVVVGAQAYKDVFLSLAGREQIRNAVLALAALEPLRNASFEVSPGQLREGLGRVFWPGRLQKLQSSPQIVVDVAHNPASVRAAMSALVELHRYRRLLLLVGLLSDKNYDEIAKILGQVADAIYVVAPDSPRALPAETLASSLRAFDAKVECLDNLKRGLEFDLMPHLHADDLLCVIGSHYLAGEFLGWYQANSPKRT